MDKELQKFQERYRANKEIQKAAWKAAKKPTKEGQQEYMRLSREYGVANRKLYREMSEAGLDKEWYALEVEFRNSFSKA